MSKKKSYTVIGIKAVLLVLVLVVLYSLFVGWLFMLGAGACGWHIPLFPVGLIFGFAIGTLLSALQQS